MDQIKVPHKSHPSLQSMVEDDELIGTIYGTKYRWKKEILKETFKRVVDASFGKDHNASKTLRQQTYSIINDGYFMPGGRIVAGAGTTKRVTLMNCYVAPTIPDSMEGIADVLKVAMLTQQQGGGIGMDFSTLRPEKAELSRTGALASGPMPFMELWDAMCKTIMSAGDRRGAMMGTMCDTHPDILRFITAKHKPDILRMFNVSVLVSDAFMAAVEDDADWHLYFCEPSGRGQKTFVDDNGVKQYVYQIMKARDLWDAITTSTFEYSEPGVIFIDRINELNNLQYCEDIRCTNPCGEQPLPPNACCLLGAINLGRLVIAPFTDRATFDFDTLRQVTWLAVRFLDNIIDVTRYPIPAQKKEEQQKRRLGLGVAGLADAMAFMNIRYGSPESILFAKNVMKLIAFQAYQTSTDLACEKGNFPMFDKASYFNGFAGAKLPAQMIDRIHNKGIRNSLLLTIAPTGTTSILFGNISGGGEPTFLHKAQRRVLQNDGTYKEFVSYGYSARVWKAVMGDVVPYGDHMVTSDDLKVKDHVAIQGACQEWVDASVSKTINCPEDISFEDFQEVYRLAYDKGCKGCTTYKPSETRGAVLSDPDTSTIVLKRPDVLEGRTYKLNWPSWSSAVYITINEDKGQIYEIFISSKDARYQEWTIALSIMISRLLRQGESPEIVAGELQQIQSTHDSAWVGKKRYGSFLARIGEVINQHVTENRGIPAEDLQQDTPQHKAEICPQCQAPSLIAREGCKSCNQCGYTTCG